MVSFLYPVLFALCSFLGNEAIFSFPSLILSDFQLSYILLLSQAYFSLFLFFVLEHIIISVHSTFITFLENVFNLSPLYYLFLQGFLRRRSISFILQP